MEAEVKAKKIRAPRAPRAKAVKAVEAEEKLVEEASGRYLYAVGRRKESVAQVRLTPNGKGTITVNEQKFEKYFPVISLQEALKAPLKAVGQDGVVDIWARVKGGGNRGQAEAIRLGISRALVMQDPTFRVSLKRLDFLRRDPRVKERKKYGLKGARRAPQWAKR